MAAQQELDAFWTAQRGGASAPAALAQAEAAAPDVAAAVEGLKMSFASGLPDCCTTDPDTYKVLAEMPNGEHDSGVPVLAACGWRCAPRAATKEGHPFGWRSTHAPPSAENHIRSGRGAQHA